MSISVNICGGVGVGIKVTYEYFVVSGYLEQFIGDVNKFLELGWTLQGGASIVDSDNVRGLLYTQAMTKETAVYEKEA